MIVSLLTCQSAMAYDFEVDGIYYDITSAEDLTVSVTSSGAYDKIYFDDVRIPETVTNDGKTYTVTSISDEALSYSGAVISVVIPNSVEVIGNDAFYLCRNMTSVTLGNGVREIGKGAFYNCGMLTSINIPGSVTAMGDYTFMFCNSLRSAVIGEGITKITTGMFSECTMLESVTIPNSVTEICDHAFNQCKALVSVTIPNGVTKVGASAFGSSGLTSVIIPASVTEIGSYAFGFCYSLSEVHCNSATPPLITGDTFDFNGTLYVPTGCADLYKADQNWGKFRSIKEEAYNGIQQPSAQHPNGDNVIYNVNGQKVNTENTESLPRGIYIVNGKKIIINR